MPETKKNIIDSILIILTRFQRSDESRFDEDWLSYKIDQVRAELIIKQYAQTNVIDYAWLSNVDLLNMYKVNRADNNTVDCCFDISKTTIPQTITLQNKDGNLDLGIYSLVSATSSGGITTYYPERMSLWGYRPEGHTSGLFGHYARVNTSLYVDRIVNKLKLTAILLSPEDGYLINSAPVPSGSIVLGVAYYVVGSQIYYNGAIYQPCTTFIGAVAPGQMVVNPNYSGSGTVYLNAQVASYRDVDPYPAGGEMIRMIELEILTKEFGIERQQIEDIRNDSKDDASKAA